jgi:hypothetical protein
MLPSTVHSACIKISELFVDENFFSGKPAKEVIPDDEWYKSTFIPTIQVHNFVHLVASGGSG